MDLDPVEAGLPRTKGRLAVCPDRVAYVRLGHLAPPRLLGTARKRWGQGRLPRQLRAGQKAAVGQLQDDPAALAVDGLCHPGKPGDAAVAVDAQLAPHRKPLGPDMGMAGNDEPHTALGELAHEPDEFVGADAIGRCKTLPGCRADHAIGKFKGADFRGLKKNGFTHANPRSALMLDLLLTRPWAPDM